MGTQAEKDIQPDIFPPRQQIIDCRGQFNVRETIYLLSKRDILPLWLKFPKYQFLVWLMNRPNGNRLIGG